MSVLVATQIAAVATAVLALFAVVTAVFAYLAFREQSSEVATLQQQAERDIEQRRRDQAIRVFAWADHRPYDDPTDIRAAACLRKKPPAHLRHQPGLGSHGPAEQTSPAARR